MEPIPASFNTVQKLMQPGGIGCHGEFYTGNFDNAENDVGSIFAYQRFAAGEPYFADAHAYKYLCQRFNFIGLHQA